VDIFKNQKGPVNHVYLTGASEGGLITTLAVEQRPDLFSGGVAACGPIGSFPAQVNYFGDFRVVFDYYYPGLIPGPVTEIPEELIANWDAYYTNVVLPTVLAPENLVRTVEMIVVSNAPFDPGDFWATAERSIRDGLWYNVFGTNDAVAKLGGQPFDNTAKIYLGSSNDLFLNILVQRFAADSAALAEMTSFYDTTGALARPLITLQTSRDQQVPAWHQAVYFIKTALSGSFEQHIPIPIDRYGHCNFTAGEVLVSFALMVLRAEGLPLQPEVERALPAAKRPEFRRLAKRHGLTPRK
jgi:hypothetical protein